MEALQSAYAGIILNTAREAAARIMAAERKAAFFQQNALSIKEEAVSMLLRLKQVMDSKISDAEMTSLRQNLKIEELEAQLYEAEDVVVDLRAQLEVVQHELEDMKKSRLNNFAALHENSSQEDEVNALEAISLPLLDTGSGFEDVPFDQRKICDDYCFPLKSATPLIVSSGKFSIEKNCAGNAHLASIIMASKDPALYRNRSTQRVRAFDQNLLPGNVHVPQQTDDQDSNKNSRLTAKEDNTADMTCTVASPREYIIELAEEKPTGLKESLGQDNSSDKQQGSPSSSLRKCKSKYRKTVAVPCAQNVMQNSAYSTCYKGYQLPGDHPTESAEDFSRITAKEVLKDSESHLNPVILWNKTTTGPLSDIMYDSGHKTEIPEVHLQNSVTENKVSVDNSGLSNQDAEVAASLRIRNCWRNYEAPDLPTNSNSKDIITRNTNDKAINKSAGDRLLRYTFQRKRKKGPLSCPDKSEYQENNTGMKKSGDEPIDLEPHKSSLLMESSWDSQQLVQVARQLTSSSEKRW